MIVKISVQLWVPE